MDAATLFANDSRLASIFDDLHARPFYDELAPRKRSSNGSPKPPHPALALRVSAPAPLAQPANSWNYGQLAVA